MGPDQGTAPGLTTVLSPISHTLESSGGRLTRRSRRTLLNSGRGFLPAYGLFGIVETDLSSGRLVVETKTVTENVIGKQAGASACYVATKGMVKK